MTFQVKNKKDLNQVYQRGRCIICGGIGSMIVWCNINDKREKIIVCSTQCKHQLQKLANTISNACPNCGAQLRKMPGGYYCKQCFMRYTDEELK
jgi:predicted RNA-binding Zn-ribbon protein involved in translation (DUF1610 family)